MEKATITTREFLVEGGCNACGLINCCTYTLHFTDSPDQTVENMDEAALVTAIALKGGWHQGTEPVGIGEDAIYFQKDGEKIYFEEDNFKTTFKKGSTTITCPKYKVHDRQDLPAIFAKTNEVLTSLFQLPAYDFVMVD